MIEHKIERHAFISDGKGGMPPFKSSLSEDQIHSLVAHIRTLRARK
jgi:mono/diheme cytochrome c family protein